LPQSENLSLMKTLLLALALVPLLGYSQLVDTGADIQFEPRSSDMQVVQSNSKSTSCGPDTVLYTLQKATGLQVVSINNGLSAKAVSQYYNCPQPLTLSGVEFYAYKMDATGGISQNVTVEVYTAGVDSMPTGLPLVTTTVLVDTNFGGGRPCCT